MGEVHLGPKWVLAYAVSPREAYSGVLFFNCWKTSLNIVWSGVPMWHSVDHPMMSTSIDFFSNG